MYAVQPGQIQVLFQELGNVIVGEIYIVGAAGDGGKSIERCERDVDC